MLKASTLSSKTSRTDQGTEERSFSKADFEKFLNERRLTVVGRGLGTVQQRRRRMGRWSEKEESKTREFEMGTSGVVMNRSKMEPEELE